MEQISLNLPNLHPNENDNVFEKLRIDGRLFSLYDSRLDELTVQIQNAINDIINEVNSKQHIINDYIDNNTEPIISVNQIDGQINVTHGNLSSSNINSTSSIYDNVATVKDHLSKLETELNKFNESIEEYNRNITSILNDLSSTISEKANKNAFDTQEINNWTTTYTEQTETLNFINDNVQIYKKTDNPL